MAAILDMVFSVSRDGGEACLSFWGGSLSMAARHSRAEETRFNVSWSGLAFSFGFPMFPRTVTVSLVIRLQTFLIDWSRTGETLEQVNPSSSGRSSRRSRRKEEKTVRISRVIIFLLFFNGGGSKTFRGGLVAT